MENYLSLLEANPLFDSISREDLPNLLHCLQARERSYAKGEVLFAEGQTISQLGVIISGRVNTVYDDLFGNRSILGVMEAGQLFCDAFCCASDNRAPVSVTAQTECRALLIQAELVLHTCAHSCRQHQRLAENLVHILADKYLAQSRKMIHLSEKTTRQKLLSYLSEQLRRAGGNPFPLPFNRQELADYLFVDRSGLSVQWNLLKKQGILQEHQGLCSLHPGPRPAALDR